MASGVSARPSRPPAPRRTISFSRSMTSNDRSGPHAHDDHVQRVGADVDGGDAHPFSGLFWHRLGRRAVPRGSRPSATASRGFHKVLYALCAPGPGAGPPTRPGPPRSTSRHRALLLLLLQNGGRAQPQASLPGAKRGLPASMVRELDVLTILIDELQKSGRHGPGSTRANRRRGGARAWAGAAKAARQEATARGAEADCTKARPRGGHTRTPGRDVAARARSPERMAIAPRRTDRASRCPLSDASRRAGRRLSGRTPPHRQDCHQEAAIRTRAVG